MSALRWCARMAVAAALLFAACQPLPHPFADDVPPPGLLRVRDSVSLSVAPVAGEPRQVAGALAGAVAKALRKHGIAASSRTAGIGSDELLGTLAAAPGADGRMAVTVRWQLEDAAGHPLGRSASRLEAPAEEWRDNSGGAVARLAAASADKLAILFLGRPPSVASAAKPRRPRIAVAGVEGAPGDGGKSLATAIAFVLKSQGVEILADGKEKPDLVLDALVTLGKAKGGKQHISIVWQMRRAGGGMIGTVAQQNDVAAGSLDGKWGDTAYLVAAAAREGIMQLVIRGISQAGKS
ncbi:MAG TPA: hypothetical protein VM755_13710 [Stellaceae bacterium]|nr:hypothetical protein [Stellaceae bacterium]